MQKEMISARRARGSGDRFGIPKPSREAETCNGVRRLEGAAR